ncbi:MAG: NACHT domain-containing protein, partial [Nitrospirae bacterium]|nr:NACHT domain-containing protein [Nitrospirota bacterium]
MAILENTYKKDIGERWSYPVDSNFVGLEFSSAYIAYRARLDALYRKADMVGVMNDPEDTPTLLKHIYVPLRIDEKDVDPASSEVDNVKGLYIVDALCRIRFLAISGAPGSGKSTMTQFLAAALSQTILNETASVLGRRVVVPFILRELDFSKINSWDDLWNLWIKDMSERLNMSITREFLDFYIEKGWAIVIFDGIDEIGEEQNLNMIKWINKWIEAKSEFKDAMTPLNIIITGRPYGYLSEGEYDRYFKKMYLLPFNQNQIEQYAYNWFGVQYGEDKLKVKMKSQGFITALKGYGLEELKRRPIFLAMLAYVTGNEGELPQTRLAAYKKIVEAYIHYLDVLKNIGEKRDDKPKYWSFDDKIGIMEELAYKIHTKAESELNYSKLSDNKQMHIQISRDTLESYFRDILNEGWFNTVKITDLDEIIKYFLKRSGLIIEPKNGYYQFSHLTFQEYLTAARIYNNKQDDDNNYLKREIFDRLKQVGWHEVALLFFGMDKVRIEKRQSKILQKLIEKDELSHHKFLIDLFTGMEHKISKNDVIKWLKTLVYVWVTREKVKGLYKYLADAIKSDKMDEIRKCIVDYMKKLSDKILHNDDLFYDSSDMIVDDKCNNVELLCCNIEDTSLEQINLLENILLVGFFWHEFREGFFNRDNASLLPADKRNLRIAFIIDKYILFNKECEDILSHKMYSAIKLNELYLGTGSFIYYLSNNISYDIIKPFYKLFMYSHSCLLYLNNTNDMSMLKKIFISVFRAM